MIIDVTFVATNVVEHDVLLSEEKLFNSYLPKDNDGRLGLEAVWIDSYVNLDKMLAFLFKVPIDTPLRDVENKRAIFDLSKYKNDFLSFEELENRYQSWIHESGRANTMDEYGQLLGVVGYLLKNRDKKHLMLIVKKRG
jgi:hypothetical protein